MGLVTYAKSGLTLSMQSQGVMAMMRHYIGNEGETGRQWTSSNIDDR
jgi:beta-glucosidase-like glycosyl hydrolase